MVLNRFRIGGADVVSASEGEQHLAGRGAHGVVDLSLPVRFECGAGLGGLGSGHDASRGGVHGEVASVVDETTPNSVVVTAAHCAFDWAAGSATNWMFIPGFEPGDTFTGCATTDYGCWTASSLWVNDAFKNAKSFNDTAVTNDFAFAVMGPSISLSSSNKVGVLDAAVGSQPITFTRSLTTDLGTPTTSLGYPQASPYDGTTLHYCQNTLARDEYSKLTYRLPCGMTGGSSGGPWYSPLGTDGTGTVMSVNSYSYTRDIRTTKYNDTAMMYGPVFNTATETLYNNAVDAAGR